ncbi:MAG: hypothetical protein Q4D31_02470 [Eubacteriales bacterium]|nr:hypothetical protein [Eubacteriales bacterium]
MLKLLKYEWKACARVCLPLYAAVVLLAAVNHLTMNGAVQEMLFGIPTIVLAMLYTGVMVAVFVVTGVILLQRFYKNLLGDEGYLMFTLPVTVTQHIWSKLLVAVVMSDIATLAALLSIGILFDGMGAMSGFGSLLADLGHLFTGTGHDLLYMIETAVFLMLTALTGMLFLYLCIALGHLAKKHRVLMAVVWYFVLSTVGQSLLMMLFIGAAELGDPVTTLADFVRGLGPVAGMHVVLLGLCAGMAAVGAAFFAGTRYILKNRLNLE